MTGFSRRAGREDQLGSGAAVGSQMWRGSPPALVPCPSPVGRCAGDVALHQLPPRQQGCESGTEPARPHPAHELQNNPHCGMGTGSGTAAFLPLPASTIPAMLLPWHPALEPSSPPKTPLPPGTLWVLAAPRAGLGTLYAQPRLGRERRNLLSRMCSGAVRWPGWGCAGAIFIWGKMRLTS